MDAGGERKDSPISMPHATLAPADATLTCFGLLAVGLDVAELLAWFSIAARAVGSRRGFLPGQHTCRCSARIA